MSAAAGGLDEAGAGGHARAGADVLGVGIDVVSVARFGAGMARTPSLLDRLFTSSERMTPAGLPRRAASLAARFATKEAVAKALGVPRGLDWHDCQVVVDDTGRPGLAMTGTVAACCAERGIARWQLSLTHDAGIAAAMVVALG